MMEELIIGAPIAVVLLATSIWGAHRAIRSGLKAPRRVGNATPDQHGLIYYSVKVSTRNGKTLAGWLIPTTGAGAGEPTPAIVILHGWGGNAASMLPLARPLHAAGYTLLLIEARCHGRSDGDSFASLPRFAEDLDSAIDWLKNNANIDRERVSVLGHSVGGGAALLAASRRDDLHAVVSVAAFADPAAMMRRWLATKHIPYRPFGWYILRYVQRVIRHRFADIAPVNTIAKVRCPVLLVHGQRDATAPVDEAQQIHARRGTRDVQLLIVDGDHETFVDLKKQIDKLLAFLAHPSPRAGDDAELPSPPPA